MLTVYANNLSYSQYFSTTTCIWACPLLLELHILAEKEVSWCNKVVKLLTCKWRKSTLNMWLKYFTRTCGLPNLWYIHCTTNRLTLGSAPMQCSVVRCFILVCETVNSSRVCAISTLLALDLSKCQSLRLCTHSIPGTTEALVQSERDYTTHLYRNCWYGYLLWSWNQTPLRAHTHTHTHTLPHVSSFWQPTVFMYTEHSPNSLSTTATWDVLRWTSPIVGSGLSVRV